MPTAIKLQIKSVKQQVLLRYRVRIHDKTGSRDCDIKILPDRKTLTIRPVGDIKEVFDLADNEIKIRNLKTGRLDLIEDEKTCLVLTTNRKFKPFYFTSTQHFEIIASINSASKHWADLWIDSVPKFLFKSSMETFQNEIINETTIFIKNLRDTLMWYNFDDNQISAVSGSYDGKNDGDLLKFSEFLENWRICSKVFDTQLDCLLRPEKLLRTKLQRDVSRKTLVRTVEDGQGGGRKILRTNDVQRENPGFWQRIFSCFVPARLPEPIAEILTRCVKMFLILVSVCKGVYKKSGIDSLGNKKIG